MLVAPCLIASWKPAFVHWIEQLLCLLAHLCYVLCIAHAFVKPFTPALDWFFLDCEYSLVWYSEDYHFELSFFDDQASGLGWFEAHSRPCKQLLQVFQHPSLFYNTLCHDWHVVHKKTLVGGCLLPDLRTGHRLFFSAAFTRWFAAAANTITEQRVCNLWLFQSPSPISLLLIRLRWSASWSYCSNGLGASWPFLVRDISAGWYRSSDVVMSHMCWLNPARWLSDRPFLPVWSA